MIFFLGGEGEREEHVLQGGKAGIPEGNADCILFLVSCLNFQKFHRLPTAGGDGGGDQHRSLISTEGRGD